MFSSLIAHRAKVQPDAVAIIGPRGNLTYQRFNESIDKVANRLREMLPSGGELVAVDDADVTKKWLLLLALSRLGRVSVTAPAAGGKPVAGLVLSDKPGEGDGHHLLADDWWRDMAATASSAPLDIRVDWDDPAHLIVSSGTTGVPKKTVFTHRTLLRRIEDQLLAQSLGPVLGSETRLLVTMGTATIGGFLAPLITWTVGGATILALDPMRDIEKLRSLKVTSMVIATGQFKELVDKLPPHFEPMPRLSITVGGSILTKRLADEAVRRLTPNLFVAYGSTEGGVVCSAPASRLDTEANEVGFCYPWMETEVVGADGAPLPKGEVGEVRIKAQGVVPLYEGDAEATAAAFRGGWFYPGDLGAISAEGALRVVGRTAETINVGGAKVTAESIEGVFTADAGVHDAAAFSITDAYGVEEACIAIVRGEAFDESAVRKLVEQNLALKRIKVFFVPRIPRNEMGKVQRSALKELVMTQAKEAAR